MTAQPQSTQSVRCHVEASKARTKPSLLAAKTVIPEEGEGEEKEEDFPPPSPKSGTRGSVDDPPPRLEKISRPLVMPLSLVVTRMPTLPLPLLLLLLLPPRPAEEEEEENDALGEVGTTATSPLKPPRAARPSPTAAVPTCTRRGEIIRFLSSSPPPPPPAAVAAVVPSMGKAPDHAGGAGSGGRGTRELTKGLAAAAPAAPARALSSALQSLSSSSPPMPKPPKPLLLPLRSRTTVLSLVAESQCTSLEACTT